MLDGCAKEVAEKGYLHCSTKEFYSDTQSHVMDMRYVFQDEASAGKFVVAIVGYWSESEVTLETKIDEVHSLYPQVHVCATISMAKSKTDSPKKPATSMPSAKTCPTEKQMWNLKPLVIFGNAKKGQEEKEGTTNRWERRPYRSYSGRKARHGATDRHVGVQ